MNEWRLPQCRDLFYGYTVGADEILESFEHPEKYGSKITPALKEELSDYLEEELFTVNVIYLWRKPENFDVKEFSKTSQSRIDKLLNGSHT